MFNHSIQSKSPQKLTSEEESWEYIDKRKLKRSFSACVCMTCHYFDYSCDQHCRTLLICKIQEKLIPNGNHLIMRCPLWNKRAQLLIHDCPDAA